MPKDRTYTYEAMFLLSQGAAADFAGALKHIHDLLSRAGAEVIAMKKWDERRLAYEIDKQRRGLYILTYFSAPASAMAQFERDCNLSETVMRTLLIRADHLTTEEMTANDERDKLQAEAKLRAERPAPAPAAAARPEPVPAGADASEEA